MKTAPIRIIIILNINQNILDIYCLDKTRLHFDCLSYENLLSHMKLMSTSRLRFVQLISPQLNHSPYINKIFTYNMSEEIERDVDRKINYLQKILQAITHV